MYTHIHLISFTVFKHIHKSGSAAEPFCHIRGQKKIYPVLIGRRHCVFVFMDDGDAVVRREEEGERGGDRYFFLDKLMGNSERVIPACADG